MKVVVYTDGGCTANGFASARASYAYYFPDNKSLSFAGRVPDDQPQTNNRGELLAILSAVEKTIESFDPSETDVFIYTDSDYSKNCLTKWMPGWIKKGWKTASGDPVKNRDLIEQVSGRLILFQSYSINWVKAHTGGSDEHSRNNHIVDRMAAEVIEGKKEDTKSLPIKTIEGCPLQLVGPPVSEKDLINWCLKNLDKIDQRALHLALISAYGKTCKKTGTEIVKQKLHTATQYRLIASSHIITHTDKEE